MITILNVLVLLYQLYYVKQDTGFMSNDSRNRRHSND